MKLHNKILSGLVLGAAAGIIVNLVTQGGPGTRRFVSYVTEPIGKMWLSAMIMVVIPLIISTLSIGVAGLGSFKKLGRVGILTLVCFSLLTATSTIFGLAAMNTFKPGQNLDSKIKVQLMETYKGQAESAMGLSDKAFSIELLVKIIPRNPVKAAAEGDMLAVIFFALMLGMALTMLPPGKARPMLEFMDSLGHVTVAILELVMKLAPIGVFCLIFSVMARFGFHLLFNLAQYMAVVIGTMIVFALIVYPFFLWFLGRWNPLLFFRQTRLVMITAFSTSSSNATLPTTMRVAEEEMKLPREISSFVLPLGATMNMNGTALFEGATILFLAQVFGVELKLGAQVIVLLMSVITAIGVAGIPGGSIPLIMMVLGMVGVPMEGIAIVLGVDRLLDMCRTTLNVTGDLVTATIVNHFTKSRET